MTQAELIDVAAAIADGRPIDWADAGRTPTSDFTLRARIVERIAQVHASFPSVDSVSSSLHKSLDGVSLPGDGATVADTPVTWGPLTLVEKIGRGTFGDVYRAHDRRLNRMVALKLLRRRDRREAEVIEEGRVMACVHHPNVVAVYGAERIEGRVGLWMQFVEGPTLEEDVRKRGRFTASEVVETGVQLARALGAVHRAGLLHRDVKAQNAMRDADGRVLLTDFGTGRELSETSVTSGGPELAGTPLYMAPEVLNGGPASVASDVYSLGVLLYHLATASFPVTGRSLRELRGAHQRGNRTLLRKARPDIPKGLAAALDCATHPDAAARHASAADLEAALAGSFRSRARRALWAAAAVLALATLALISARPWDRPPSMPAVDTPRDFVLVSRFHNMTGETTFDRGIEYAVSRELSNTGVVDIVPAERVIDALQLMKRPIDTVMDPTMAREVALRDGRVKALIAGRIQRTRTGYETSAEIIDPADGTVVGSVGDAAETATAVMSTVTRQARRLRDLFIQRRADIKGSPPLVERVATTSLQALQLYNQAVQAHRDWRLQEARRLLDRAVAEDPDFGSAWVGLAFVRRQAGAPEAEVEAARRRAAELAETAPEWERRYIRGAVANLRGDYLASVPEFEAVVRLRPEFRRAGRMLTDAYLLLGQTDAAVATRKAAADQRPLDIAANHDAAQNILLFRDNPDEARPYIDRLDELLTPDRSNTPGFYAAAIWRRMLPAFEAWKVGDIAAAQAIVDREANQILEWPENARRSMRVMVGVFYLSFGRLRDAERHIRASGDSWYLIVLAEARGDRSALRDALGPFAANYIPPDLTYRLVNAGLTHRARTRLRGHSGGTGDILEDIGRGALALSDGHPERAVRLLRASLQGSEDYLSTNYQGGCELLAAALVSLNRRTEAISDLERCAAVPPRFSGTLNASYWMKNQLLLAEQYRMADRTRDAERIEHRLGHLLFNADTDHPLLVRLITRNSAQKEQFEADPGKYR